jgi:VWFA-related protein
MRGFLPVLLCLALALAGIAQTASVPTIRTGTRIVVVDVNVTDAHGNPVQNLKQADFRVFENGDPQAVNQFEEHSASTTAELAKDPVIPKLEPNVYTNFTPMPENGSANVLLVDSLNTAVDKQVDMRRQLLAFLKTMKSGTRLALFGLTTRLSMLQGFTSDPQLLLAALTNKDVQQSPILPGQIGTMALSDDLAQISAMGQMGHAVADARRTEDTQAIQLNRLRAVDTLGALNQLAHYLSAIPGRKNLIWFSGSFPLNALTTNGFMQVKFRETMNLLARSHVAVYPVDSLGLANTPLSDVSAAKYVAESGAAGDDFGKFTTQVGEEQSTMRRVAESTGGKAYTNVNDLGQAMGQILDSGSNYYTLVYSPRDEKEDGTYRKIAVHIASANYNLAYRNGYYADASNAQPQPSREDSKSSDPVHAAAANLGSMHAAMQRGAPAPTEIIFKAMLVASPKSSDKLADGNVASRKSKPPYRLVTVAYAANPGDITMPQRPDGIRQIALEFVILVYDRDGQIFTRQSNPVNVFAKPEAIQQFSKEGVRYQQQIAVPAKGEYYLRVGIHDMLGDKVGAIEIPAASIATLPAQPAPTPAK